MKFRPQDKVEIVNCPTNVKPLVGTVIDYDLHYGYWIEFPDNDTDNFLGGFFQETNIELVRPKQSLWTTISNKLKSWTE